MDNKSIQRLLTAAGYYNRGIDGDIGAKSLEAIDKILKARASECTSDPQKWSAQRRKIGAAQLVLKHAGFEPGSIDGYAGHNTEEALRAWDYFQANGKREVVDRTPVVPAIKTKFPKQKDCPTFYGKPGPEIEKQLVSITLPFKMRIDWNLNQKTDSLRFHKKCADSALTAWRAIYAHYGEDRLRKLGLDRNAGTYMHRQMRGGTSWSMHAYGCAEDVYAGPNGLRVTCPQALFCGDEYKAYFDIWEANGWTSLGRAIGRDWMHVQAASL
jgi:hypothetical protein